MHPLTFTNLVLKIKIFNHVLDIVNNIPFQYVESLANCKQF